MKHLTNPLPYSLLLLVSAFVFMPLACKRVVKNDAYYEAVSQYIYAYTSGDIGRNDQVRVRFVHAAVGQEQIGQPVADALFSVSPAFPGEAVWEDDRTILLTPGEALPYGKVFTGTVNIGKIYPKAPSEASVFEFRFQVRELSFSVQVIGVHAADQNDLRQQQIMGNLLTSDPVENSAAEQLLKAQQGNKNLLITWSHGSDGREHRFTIEEVERGNVRTKVDLSWDGAGLGLKQSGASEVVVPALDEFVVLSAQVIQGDEQYIALNFSDPILAGQLLDGLIRLADYDDILRFAIDGNFVRVYPANRINGSHTLRVEAGIQNIAGARMKERNEWPLVFEDLKPAVRLVGRGAIIPQKAGGAVIFPFEAVGLRAVDIEVFKIFNSNILQYLQVNELEGDHELERVGKIVLQKKVDLRSLNPDASVNSWQRYALDLQEVIQQDPGAIYQVRIAFRRGYTAIGCSSTASAGETDIDDLAHLSKLDEDGKLVSIFGGYRGIYFDESSYDWGWYDEDEDEDSDTGRYRWTNREDPCKREYYNYEHFTQRNVFVSDLGITAKRGKDGSLFAAVTDLHTTEPVDGVDLEFFNYQLQSIGKVRTGNGGTAMVENFRERPFVVVAIRGDRKGYLRMADGGSLSLSRFDVAGVELQKGLKGYIYGERGVWRPGDSLFLNFVLEDRTGDLPAAHPVTFELSDPKGSLYYRTVTTQPVNGVYALHCATSADAPTGNWTAKVQVGGATFNKLLKIETVKPNRLKMELDFGKKRLGASDQKVTGALQVNWLHGAPAKNLKARVEVQVRSTTTNFDNFKDFAFDDPTRTFYSDPQLVFDGALDENGKATVPLSLSDHAEAPGKLIASFKVRAFEAGGDFSSDNFSLDYFPYDRFVGVSIPKNRWGAKVIDQKGGQIQFAMVDQNGKPLANRKVEVGLYRCDWRWWWDEDYDDNVAQFNSSNHMNAQDHVVLTTDNRGLASWKVKPGNWGRYLVRISDQEGGHSAGDFFWSGYPGDLQDMNSRNAAAMLPFSVGKDKYNVGEEVTLTVPASENGRILLTLENGARVIRHEWVEAVTGDNILRFKATPDMAPTVYAHVSLMQPHAQTKNDLPIRMYGVMPVIVENPVTHLKPVLDMPDVLRPGETFTVKLKEQSGKACAYTLAVVDEGLLDLTRFETPNPWNAFFAREALGVKTWDIYDYVLGAFGATLERILSVGGDAINRKARNAAQINRFKPTVIHLGPFYLEKGQTVSHQLKIDDYVGSVRVMAVCSAPAAQSQGAYGSAEKACPVRKPLMIMPTLPRVLGPNETLRLPVDVFAMEKKVKNATIRVKESTGLVKIEGAAVQQLYFESPGQEMTWFDLKVGRRTGPARFTITAEGGGETTTSQIEIMVRNPNPTTTRIWEGVLEPGSEWTTGFDPGVFSDISSAKIEVSALPPINLSRHLEYLIRYPHGCIEQTVSTAFPQLFVDILAPMTDKEQKKVARNVKAAVDKMRSFQNQEGGFSYWPGGGGADDWSSSYAGHFLLEAQAKGYVLPAGVLDRWANYQTRVARQWSTVNEDSERRWMRFDADLTQAYRLYTLALAGKPSLGDMNRLRERKDLYKQSAYLLAAAYARAGKPETAQAVMTSKWKEDYRYNWYGSTYGSDLRDQSLMLETCVATGDMDAARKLMEQICRELGKDDSWFWNTQSLATSLRSLASYVKAGGSANMGPVYAYKTGGNSYRDGDVTHVISLADFTEKAFDSDNVAVRNKGKTRLYARLIVSGQPLGGEEQPVADNIEMNVRYTDLKGNPIEVDRLKQGTDFVAEVTVSRKKDTPLNFPFTELALSQIFPSGWEVLNSRMNNALAGGSSPADYQDVRDDRVYTYFDLPNRYYNPRSQGSRVESRTYRIQLNAAYTGRYYLPGVYCEAMYDSRIRAGDTGKWVEVI